MQSGRMREQLAKPTDSPKGKIYTRKVMAEILGVSERHLRRLVEDGNVTEFSHGHFKLLPTVQGYINYLHSQLGGGDDYNVERARLTRAKREDAELELQLKRNELHRAADVEFIMGNMLAAFKAKLETLPHKVLPSLLNMPPDKDKAEHILETLTSTISEALGELVEYNPQAYSTNKNTHGGADHDRARD